MRKSVNKSYYYNKTVEYLGFLPPGDEYLSEVTNYT